MTRVLIASWAAAGHVGPLRPIARELVSRGHEVRWYAGQLFADQIKSTGADYEPMAPELDHDERPFDDVFPERARLKGIKKLKWDMKNLFIGPAVTEVAELRRILETYPADVIVYDVAFNGARLLRELGGPPVVSVGVTPLTLPSRDVAPFGLALSPSQSVMERIRNAALRSLVDRVIMRDVILFRDGVWKQLGLAPSRETLMESWLSRDLHLQSGVASLDYPRSDLPAHVHYIGALHDQSVATEVPAWWNEVEASSKPIVHVTQGTIANTDFSELVVPTIRALADEDVLVVVTLGAASSTRSIPDLPPNARVAPYLPYDRLLPLTSVVVTNGGFGGVNHALYHGVPLVVAGATEDKPEVAARVAWSGVGVNLRKARPNEAEIRAAVRSVLHDKQYKENASAMAAEYRRSQAAPRAADLIERLVK